MGAISQLPKIKKLLDQNEISSGVRGAAIAAISRLTGKSNNLDILRSNLDLDNQNDRQSAVQDIIDAKAFKLIPCPRGLPGRLCRGDAADCFGHLVDRRAKRERVRRWDRRLVGAAILCWRGAVRCMAGAGGTTGARADGAA